MAIICREWKTALGYDGKYRAIFPSEGVHPALSLPVAVIEHNDVVLRVSVLEQENAELKAAVASLQAAS